MVKGLLDQNRYLLTTLITSSYERQFTQHPYGEVGKIRKKCPHALNVYNFNGSAIPFLNRKPHTAPDCPGK